MMEIVKPNIVQLPPSDRQAKLDAWTSGVNEILTPPWVVSDSERTESRRFMPPRGEISVDEAFALADLFRPHWHVRVVSEGQEIQRNGTPGGRTLTGNPRVHLLFSLPEPDPPKRGAGT